MNSGKLDRRTPSPRSDRYKMLHVDEVLNKDARAFLDDMFMDYPPAVVDVPVSILYAYYCEKALSLLVNGGEYADRGSEMSDYLDAISTLKLCFGD